ncbi:CAP domain-containing protein [Desertibacillus haloalkaliphilus]|uniref:CAP domain-containing protein n=1 Tax=Desertibacillus haloalkaliphilus TaxID=1328930 RepID=UPI001C268400|nr:CAP domain-containing protein [Desertibacillus haloalkaliphilus]
MKRAGCLLSIVTVAVVIFFVDHLLQNPLDQVSDHEGTVMERDEQTDSAGMVNQNSEQESDGLHQVIEKSADWVRDTYGNPDRIDRSAYDYDWWVYHKDDNEYIQIGVEDGGVVTVYAIGDQLPLETFSIGDTYEEISEQLSFEKKVSFKENGNSYMFELTDNELEARPLIEFDSYWVQLYFDTFTKQLSSIRFLDSATLVKQRPYSLTYRGELYEPEPLSEEEWAEVEDGQSRQILDVTNILRQRHGHSPFTWHDDVSEVAYQHSLDMYTNQYFSHTSPMHGELKDRLESSSISFQMAGENIAAKYVDAIEAVEGWLNSEGHRVNLLSDEFTHLGVGVYKKYYTQNFLTPW